MKNLQRAGGVSALIASATYIFAMALLVTYLGPMGNLELPFDEYIAFFGANRTLVFAWHTVVYLVNGVSLIVLALALQERLAEKAPRGSRVATVFGLTWAAFVIMSGLITNYGLEKVLSLSAQEASRAETLKTVIETITLGIDSSDRFLGCLWVGFASLLALRTGVLPKALSGLGILIGLLGLIGTTVPALLSIAFAFGLGVIVWWLWLGVVLLRRPIPAAREAVR